MTRQPAAKVGARACARVARARENAVGASAKSALAHAAGSVVVLAAETVLELVAEHVGGGYDVRVCRGAHREHGALVVVAAHRGRIRIVAKDSVGAKALILCNVCTLQQPPPLTHAPPVFTKNLKGYS